MMHTRQLKVKLSNIKQQFPLSSILHESLLVDANSMKIIKKEEKISPKTRQTARKSTNSKLKLVKAAVYSKPAAAKIKNVPTAASASGSTNVSNDKTSLCSTPTVVKKPKMDEHKKANETQTYITSSKLLSDNKLKITTKKSDAAEKQANVPITSALLEKVNNSNNKDISKTSLLKSNNLAATSTASDNMNAVKENLPKEKPDQTATSQPQIKPNNNSQGKPPIKLILSTVNGKPSIQNGLTKKDIKPSTPPQTSRTGTIATPNFSNISTPEVLSKPDEKTPHNCEPNNTPKVTPIKIIQNGKADNKITSTKKTLSKFSIEKVVQNLNQKQTKAQTTLTETSAMPKLKRSCSPDSSEESVSKKAKPSSPMKVEQKDPNPAEQCKVSDMTCMPTNKTEPLHELLDKGIAKKPAITLEEVKPELEKFVKEYVQREIELQTKLQKESEEHNRLKDKYESVERNFHCWIEFANKLQAKIKKIAYALNRQQDTVKLIQCKNEMKQETVAVQTDPIEKKCLPSQAIAEVKASDSNLPDTNKIVAKKPNPVQSPSKSIAVSKSIYSKPSPMYSRSASVPTSKAPVQMTKKVSHDIIDLTDETEAITRAHQTNTIHHLPQGRNMPTQRPHPLNPAAQPNEVVQRSMTSPGTIKNSMQTHGPGGAKFLGSSSLGKNVVYNAERTTMMYQQPIASTHTVHSSNTAYRMMSTTNNMGQLGRAQHQMAPQPLPTLSNNRPITMPHVVSPQNHIPSAANHGPKNTQPCYPPLPVGTSTRNIRVPQGARGPPPELLLGIKKSNSGIVLSWSNLNSNVFCAEVLGYDLYAYQDKPNASQKIWQKIGDDSIAAMDLPMACTLTQFSSGCTYYFAVRGKDIYGRFGPFSKPCSSKDLT